MKTNVGKVNTDFFLNHIQPKLGANNSKLLIKPGIGIDVSIIDLGVHNLALIVTSDPISFLPKLSPTKSAILSLNYLINDMATSGFQPQFAQFVFNLSHHISSAEFEEYWSAIHQYAQQINLSITGGHTGFIETERATTIGGGTFFSIADKSQILCSSYAQANDAILMTKSCALAASFVLATSFPNYISTHTNQHVVDICSKNLDQTSSLAEALYLKKKFAADVKAMHDVTEGGVVGAVYEMSVAAHLGFELWAPKIPIGAKEKELCQLFKINPFIVDGAGSMILACNPEKVKEIIAGLAVQGILCSEIGRFLPSSNGKKLVLNNIVENMDAAPQDPYWEAYFKAIEQELD